MPVQRPGRGIANVWLRSRSWPALVRWHLLCVPSMLSCSSFRLPIHARLLRLFVTECGEPMQENEMSERLHYSSNSDFMEC